MTHHISSIVLGEMFIALELLVLIVLKWRNPR